MLLPATGVGNPNDVIAAPGITLAAPTSYVRVAEEGQGFRSRRRNRRNPLEILKRGEVGKECSQPIQAYQKFRSFTTPDAL